MTALAITSHDAGGGVVRLLITGEIDMATADQIVAATEKVLADRPANIEIDLAGVGFLDSSGLRNLLAAHRIATDNDIKLRVVNVTGAALRVLTLTGLLDILDPQDHDGQH